MKSAPVVLNSIMDKGRSLGRIDAHFREQRDEAWVQRLIFERLEILPVNEFDEIYCPLVAAGREIETPSGFVDNLYVSPSGAITIVETKLWQNPEKHRTVVAQVIDYAKEISQWTYDDLNAAVLKASRQSADTHKQSLDDLIQPHLEVFLSKAPDDLAPVYEQWLSVWPAKGMGVYWGVTGFSLRLRVNGKLQTLLDAYPEWAVSLVRESDAKRLSIPEDSYRKYIETIRVLPEAISILGSGKKYIKHDALTADTLMLLLNATTEIGLSHRSIDEKAG